MSDTRYCIDCKHCWKNSDGTQMCGRPRDDGETGPLFCYAERGSLFPNPKACGQRGQYFEAKT